jgi:hypothetical protein
MDASRRDRGVFFKSALCTQHRPRELIARITIRRLMAAVALILAMVVWFLRSENPHVTVRVHKQYPDSDDSGPLHESSSFRFSQASRKAYHGDRSINRDRDPDNAHSER